MHLCYIRLAYKFYTGRIAIRGTGAQVTKDYSYKSFYEPRGEMVGMRLDKREVMSN